MEELEQLITLQTWGKLQSNRVKYLSKELFNFTYNGCLCSVSERIKFRRDVINRYEQYKNDQK
jgi:hypothetical protein